MTRTLCLVALTLMWWPVLAHAQSAVIVDDAYVSTRAGLANRSFGGAETLLVSPIERTFLRFSLTLPDATPGAHVAQAMLKVFVRNVKTPGEIGVYRVSGAWSERTVTGNVAPAIGAQEGAPVAVGNATEQGWVTLDVTQAVRDWLNNAALNDGFALVGAGATNVTFDSKENGGTSHEPVLEIRLGHAATAGDAARLGGLEPAGYVRTDDVRLADDRAPRPGSPHYVQNTTDPQEARFNVAHGLVRGDLTVLGTLHANVGGNFIHNRTDPQPNASFNIAGNGTVGGTLTGGVVNAATQFTIGGQRALSLGPAGLANVFVGADAGTATLGPLNTFVGSKAGMRTTVGGLNVLVGAEAGASNTEGGQNTFLGAFAGSANTTACCGTFVGNFAGSSNTTGFANVFVGGGAGGRNTTGGRNVFVGDLAGNDLDFPGFESGSNTGNVSGWFNTFVGSRSGVGVTTGSNNTFVGFRTSGAADLQFATAIGAGASVTTDNTVVLGRSVDTVVVPGALSLNIVDAAMQYNISGQRVLFADTNSRNNIFLGWLAGQAEGGRSNTILGTTAGQLNTGDANTFVGSRAGRAHGTGNSNTFVGSAAGQIHLSGDFNTFVGDAAGGSVVGGNNNSFFGYFAGRGGFQATPERNAFFGMEAGRGILTGADNAAFGYRAGFANETGISNAFFGAWAGEHTTGSYNAFFGTQAGQQNASGTHNAFFGTEAGSHNVDGFSNVFVGALAGVFNTSGTLNTFVGTSAGSNNQGSHNSFFGTYAGSSNIAGNHNSFFGRAAGFSSTADRNAFFGVGAGELTTTGGDNAFFGTGAGTANVSGTLNTLLGAGANLGAENLTNATAIGARAIVGASNALVLGNDVNVGIGTSVPGSKLTVAGIIETTTGGVRFPDGTTQVTAATGGQIAGILGGFGLLGGGTSGTLALDVGAGEGISVGPDSVSLANLGVTTAKLADGAVTVTKIAGGQVVKTLNGLTDQVTLAAGTNVNLAQAGSTITIHAVGGAVNAILNQTALQPGASFNIDGTGAAGVLDSATHYSIAGTRVFSAGDTNVFAGAGAGVAATPGTPFPHAGRNNALFGHNAGASITSGSANALFGSEAGASLSDREANSFFGYQAGRNTLASANSFFGYQSGLENTLGTSNAFFGFQAGQFNQGGSNNAFFGFRAGFRNVAAGNAFYGSNAGRENASGNRNSYFGTAAGGNIVDGNDNAIFGYDAGASFSMDASRNAFFGAAAGLSNRGSDNVFVGADAGRASVDGSAHTFVGAGAGRTLQSGFANTAIGFNAQAEEGLSNATALGANATVSQSDSVAIGSWNARVGIGTGAPREKLEVLGGNLLVGSPGQGIILRSPDGSTCRLLTITNAGDLTLTGVACPM